MREDKKPRIAIIGAGKVGSTLGIALYKKGYVISAISSRTYCHAAHLAQRVKSEAFVDAAVAALTADVVFITTPDREIQNVSSRVANGKGFRSGQVVVHTSGFLTSEELIDAQNAGTSVASMHPMQSFADAEQAIATLPGSLVAIEGDADAIPVIKTIAMDLGAVPVSIARSSKPRYHAACAIASNYLVSLVNLSVELMESIGMTEQEALTGLTPLLQGTLANVLSLGPVQSLTGPISRGDTGVVKGHLDSLSTMGDNPLRIYTTLGMHTIDVALKKGSIDVEKAEEMRRILGKYAN